MVSSKAFDGANIAITGASGTIGSALLRHLLDAGSATVKCIDNNETSLFNLTQVNKDDSRFLPHLADIRDERLVERLFRGVDFVFHAAAYKHVTMCEESPFSAVSTNVYGVENIIRAANTCNVTRVLLCSTDKAVNPTNVMGSSKLLAERLFSAANYIGQEPGHGVFASTRFGNVAGSNGSVIPIFTAQIARGGPVTLSNDTMTRFLMSIDDAIRLLTRSIEIAQGGEVFIARMPGLRIKDLAVGMIDLLAPVFGHDPTSIAIDIVGAQPGEKEFEEVLTSEEIGRTVALEDLFIIQPPFLGSPPQFYGGVSPRSVDVVPTSATIETMSHAEIREFLFRPNVLVDDIRSKLVEQPEL